VFTILRLPVKPSVHEALSPRYAQLMAFLWFIVRPELKARAFFDSAAGKKANSMPSSEGSYLHEH
jgi:hypothetical protein